MIDDYIINLHTHTNIQNTFTHNNNINNKKTVDQNNFNQKS